MPVPAASNWDVGVNPTAAILNARIRDMVQFLRNRPHAVLRRITSSQSLTSGTLIQVQFNTEDVDTDAGHDNVTNPSRYTIKTAGIYYLTATVIIQGNGTGKREAWFRVNGTTQQRYGWHTLIPGVAGGGADMCLNITAHLRLVVNDYVEVTVLQNSGSALNLNISNQDPRFEILWVSQ